MQPLIGVGTYVLTTLLVAVPYLLAHRRRPTLGAGAAIVAGVALFGLIMEEFRSPIAVAAVLATVPLRVFRPSAAHRRG